MSKRLLLAVVVCVLAASTLAVDTEWLNTTGNLQWGDSANWSTGSLPTKADNIGVRSGVDGPIISTGTNAVGKQLVIGDGGSPSDTVIVDGGTYTSTSDTGGGVTDARTILGYGAANNGTLQVNSGVVNLGSHLFVGLSGVGNLNINGGIVNVNYGMFVPGWNGGFGNIHLDGGVLHTAMWWGGAGQSYLDNHNYTFDFTEGMWIINGFCVNEIQLLIDRGWITRYGGEHGGIVITFDCCRELTIVNAIPEPVSISLLGLGGSAMLGRRRKETKNPKS